MKFKVLLLPLFLTQLGNALPVEEGTYRDQLVVSNPANQSLEEAFNTLKVSKIGNSVTEANIELSIVDGTKGCTVEKSKAEVIDDKFVLVEGACQLHVSKDLLGIITVTDPRGECKKLYCASGASLDSQFIANSRVVNGSAKTTLKPAKDQALCFSRAYSTSHMTANPNQIPDSISLNIFHPTEGEEAVSYFNRLSITKNDESAPYGGGGLCTDVKDKSARCSFDADAGNYELKVLDNGIVQMKPANAIILQRQSVPPLEDDENHSVMLESDDRDNRVFWLYPTVCQDE